ncbi:MAG TPA: GerMN domain-containing protein, partial [Herpetosiphonaceae bacterium]|nr:GerMN domain-containing protein [Herpetosiphonaceae bacterium]
GSMARLVPADTRLLGLAIENNRATANFNRLPTFGSDSLSDLGLRSVVLALTERTDVTAVQLQVNGKNIGAPRYRPNVNPDNPRQLDGQFATTSFLPLYFPVASTGQMARVIRLVPRTSTEGAATVEELIAGPGPYADVLGRPVPAATRVNSLVISDGAARLDLSQEFLQAGNRRQAVDSLALALTTFSSVRTVAISVDGTPLDSFWGADFRAPLARPALNRE